MKFPRINRNISNLAKWIHGEGSELKEGIISVVKECLTGPWYSATPSNVLIKRMSGGMSNSVFKVTLSKTNQNNFRNEPKIAIVRIHGPLNIDSVFEHLSEYVAFMFLSEKKFGPKLYGVFQGGRIEEYIDARPLITEELGDINFTLAIAEKIATFHSLNPPLTRKRGLMFDVMETWLKQIQTENFSWKTDNSETQKCMDFFRGLNLTDEISWIREYLGKSDSPILFCHNDLQQGNILVKSNSEISHKPNITLIDYEYSSYNYQAFEFANHFLEYTMSYESKDYPNFVVNEENYPSQKHQLLFIKRYLAVREHLQKLKANGHSEIPFTLLLDYVDSSEGEITEKALQLLDEISKFRLASHLLWGIWSALRSQSHISFGYWEYCKARLNAYYHIKEELKGR